MDQNTFTDIIMQRPWDLILWDDNNAYKIVSFSQDSFGIENLHNGWSYVVDKNNCELFNVHLSGESKAIMALIKKSLQNARVEF